MFAVNPEFIVGREGSRNKKLIGWVEWCEKQAPRCPACKELYNSRTPPGVPPCGKCRVELLENNQEASTIYMMCRGQVITGGMGGVIDLNFVAVKTVMDLYRVKNQQEVLEKVYKVFHHFNESRNSQT